MKKIGYCMKCGKKMEFNTDFRLGNFPMSKALACKKCSEMWYY